MFIKRLRQEAGRQNWFGVAVDLIILILGVFLGIQVNNWNQGRLDRAKGHEYRERILTDFEANIKDLTDRRRYYAAVRRFAQATLDALDHPVEEKPETFLVDAYQASQIAPRKMRRFTYDEAASTGNLELIGDATLRERLANFYTGLGTVEVTFDNVPPYREHLRFGMPARAQAAVRTDCPERFRFDTVGTAVASLPEDCSLRIDRAAALGDAKAVRAIPSIHGDLARLIADDDVKIQLVDTFRAHVIELKNQVTAAK